MSKRQRLIVLYGATGVGKTGLSIELANHLNAPIVSSDSRQVYRQMRIGTAVPSEEQLAVATHYFIHDRSVTDRFSAGDFEKEGLALLEKLFAESDDILLVGGSGLYINALLYGFDDLPTSDDVRSKLNVMSLEELQPMLAELDSEYYKQVDIHNLARVRRAVEVCLVSGRPYSEQRSGTVRKRSFEIVKIGLERPREELYRRINERVDQMVDQGLELEARSLYQYRELASLQTVGYREFFDYFDGKYSLEHAIDLIKQNTRRYAKRQTTWLRREAGITWFDPDNIRIIIEYTDGIIKNTI